MVEKKTLVVVGCGFAGYTLIKKITSRVPEMKVILVDPRESAVFLPLLPDVVAGKIEISRILFSLSRFCLRHGVVFINRSAVRLEGVRTLVLDNGDEVKFDYLALACGMEPNFYGDDRARKKAFTLAGADDARKLRARLLDVVDRGEDHTFLVVGGGYTGVETASALVYAGNNLAGGKARFRVRIAELSPGILGNLPEGIAGPARREVSRLGIGVSLSASLEVSEEGGVTLNGESIRDATLVWSAGMRTVGFIRDLPFPGDRQGRIQAGPDLSLPGAPHIFAIGDCAAVKGEAGQLRMAVQFSWAEGITASRNIIRRMSGHPGLPYRPHDLGYLIPLASGKAWGEIMGLRVGGRFGSFLHYFMCVYRTRGWGKKIGIIKDLAPPAQNSG